MATEDKKNMIKAVIAYPGWSYSTLSRPGASWTGLPGTSLEQIGAGYVSKWWVEDGQFICSAGVTAGIGEPERVFEQTRKRPPIGLRP